MSEKMSKTGAPVFRFNWSRESPVEIILVVFLVVGFFTFPRTGCGITQVETPTAVSE